MTFEEWFERYSDKNNYHSKEKLKILAKQAWEAAQPKWQPIETAPTDGTMVRVGWWENNDWYEDSDYIEDGAWIRHADHYDHFLAVAIPGMTGPKEEPPYQYWMPAPPPPNNINLTNEVQND